LATRELRLEGLRVHLAFFGIDVDVRVELLELGDVVKEVLAVDRLGVRRQAVDDERDLGIGVRSRCVAAVVGAARGRRQRDPGDQQQPDGATQPGSVHEVNALPGWSGDSRVCDVALSRAMFRGDDDTKPN
jgi:hypothetical protein